MYEEQLIHECIKEKIVQLELLLEYNNIYHR